MKDEVIILRTTKEIKEAFAKYAKEHGTDVSKILNAYMQHLVKRCPVLPIYLRPYIGQLEKEERETLTIAEIKKFVSDAIIDNNLKEKVKRVFLFGSYSRGEANENSDIDLRIEYTNGFDLMDLGVLSSSLKEATHKSVDIATQSPDKMDSLFYSNIRKDEICIYEQ